MSKFYIEDVNQLYGCFRCGRIMGDLKKEHEDAFPTCGECGENGVVTFVQALDLLNDVHLSGDLETHDEDEYLEFIILDEDEDE